MTAWWLPEPRRRCPRLARLQGVAVPTTSARLPHLLPLPSCDFDTAQVVYRAMSASMAYITASKPICIPSPSHAHRPSPPRARRGGQEVPFIYSIGLEGSRTPMRLVPHAPRPACGNCSKPIIRWMIPSTGHGSYANASANSARSRLAVPRPACCRPSRSRASSKPSNYLALIAQYQRDDVCARLERARPGFGALSPWRPSGASWPPPPSQNNGPTNLSTCTTRCPSRCEKIRSFPVRPGDYQQLLLPEEPSHETPSQEEKSDDESDPDRSKPA